ncbi:MAG: flagellar hook-associated protein FlgK [Pirellulales bacterium]|nr:flagellar hook-associated protein FlgK [Pirellulales bacterium]
MSLFGSIQLANNAIRAQQVGLQVVGQNIANANTPGYLREEVVFVPAAAQRLGNLTLGLGVEVDSIRQKVDKFLQERLRGAGSDRAGADAKTKVLSQLEGLLSELGDTDISSSLNEFFNSVQEVLNQPESVSVRNLASLKGQTLSGLINRTYSRANSIRSDVNQQVIGAKEDINRLIEEIRTLNVQIVRTEGGSVSKSDAVGLRDQREVALSNLSELISIQVQEQDSGAVNVYSGGDYLVFEGLSRSVEIAERTDHGLTIGDLRIADTDSPLDLSSGKVGGLVAARDEILTNFTDQLDGFAKSLAYEFNRIFSSGQGLTGYTSLTSERPVDDVDEPLDAAGLPFTPEHGSFQVLVYNVNTKLTETHDVAIDLDGLDDDTSLNSLATALDAIDGISAQITADRRLKIDRESSEQQFAFRNDSSGVLAALGLNVFFSGSAAGDLGVSQPIKDDPSKFAASRDGIGHDTLNGVDLAGFLNRPLDSAGGDTLEVLYDKLTGSVTQNASVSRAVADGYSVFEESLRGEQLAISGVSIDEEAVRLISYQRAFQASAKYIATINELLGILVSI